jgi:hypothetical protein
MSEVGRMVDFLKANPFVSMEDYRWKYSVPYIRLMAADNTRIHYLSEKQAKNRKSKKIDGNRPMLLNDLGIHIFDNIQTNK